MQVSWTDYAEPRLGFCRVQFETRAGDTGIAFVPGDVAVALGGYNELAAFVEYIEAKIGALRSARQL